MSATFSPWCASSAFIISSCRVFLSFSHVRIQQEQGSLSKQQEQGSVCEQQEHGSLCLAFLSFSLPLPCSARGSSTSGRLLSAISLSAACIDSALIPSDRLRLSRMVSSRSCRAACLRCCCLRSCRFRRSPSFTPPCSALLRMSSKNPDFLRNSHHSWREEP